MFNWLRKLFASTEDESVFVDYEHVDISYYREKFPDVAISEVNLPRLEHNHEFIVRKWFKKDGDYIWKYDRICIVEADSLVLELESQVEGFIYFRQKPLVPLKTGQTICVIVEKMINNQSSRS